MPITKAVTRTVTITMPTDWFAAISRRARENGETLSEFMREAAADKLPAIDYVNLSTPPTRGRPRKSDNGRPVRRRLAARRKRKRRA